MSALNGKRPMDTYKELLKIAATSLTSTLTTVETGEGIATPLKVSTTGVSIGGVTFPTTGAEDGKVLQVGVDGVTASWVTPAAGGTTDYNDLTNKPTLFSGAFADLTGTPTFSDVATSGSYNDLLDQPSLFSGSYADLTNKPSLFSGAYGDLTGTPTFADVAFSGDYADLINAPTGGGSVAWADVTDKPAVIAAGADQDSARAVIAAITKADAAPEVIQVVRMSATTTVAASVTIGSQIPGALAGNLWSVGMLQLAGAGAQRGAIYEIQANGTSTIKYAPGVGMDGGSTFTRFVLNINGQNSFWVCSSGTLNAANYIVSNNESSGMRHTYSGATSTVNLQTAINDANAPFTSAKTVYPHFTHSSLGLNTPVTLGAPIPGTVGDTFQGDWTEFMSLSFGGTMGNTYKLNTAGTAWVLQSEMPDNSYRLAICNPIASDSGYNTFSGVMMIRRSGSTRELVYYAPNATILKTGSASNSYDYIQTVVGNPSTLTTTSKAVVGAINEINAKSSPINWKSGQLAAATSDLGSAPVLELDYNSSLDEIVIKETANAGTISVEGRALATETKIGTLASLVTTDKSNLVSAINEVKATYSDPVIKVRAALPVKFNVIATYSDTSTASASKTLGGAIPGQDASRTWTIGDTVAIVSGSEAGSIYTVGTGGTMSLTRQGSLYDDYEFTITITTGSTAGSFRYIKNAGTTTAWGATYVNGNYVFVGNGTTTQNVQAFLGASTAIQTSSQTVVGAINELRSHKMVADTSTTKTIVEGDKGTAFVWSASSNGAWTAGLVSSFTSGFWFDLHVESGSTVKSVVFTPNSPNTINGVSSLTVNYGEGVRIYHNGSNWLSVRIRDLVAPRTNKIAVSNSTGTIAIDGPMLADYYTYTTGSNNVTAWTFGAYPAQVTAWSGAMLITQGGTPRTITWPASFKWEGSAPVISTTAGAVDMLTFTTFDGGTTYHASLSKGRA